MKKDSSYFTGVNDHAVLKRNNVIVGFIQRLLSVENIVRGSASKEIIRWLVFFAIIFSVEPTFAVGFAQYDTGRHYLADDPIEACKLDLTTGYTVHLNNYAGIAWLGSSFGCYCYSNPGAPNCVFVYPSCPNGFVSNSCHADPGHSVLPGSGHTEICLWSSGACVREGYDPDKNLGSQCAATNNGTNPINSTTGNKYQKEDDFGGVSSSLTFVRNYNSYAADYSGDIGVAWRHNYSAKIFSMLLELNNGTIENQSQTSDIPVTATSVRPNGRVLLFDNSYSFSTSSVTSASWDREVDSIEKLISLDDGQGNITGWQLILQDNTVEDYGTDGKLLSITDLNGRSQTLSYDLTVAEGGDDNPDTLDKVEDDFGHSLIFAYDAQDRMVSMTDPEGGVYRYAYEANGMLQYVSYPDNTPGTSGSNPFGEDNPYRTYHYEDTNFSTALTGITDETGNRYATWTYDNAGRATSSEHNPGSGTDHVMLDYTYIDDATDPRVTVTNELGKDTTYHYTTLHGVRKVTQVEGHPTANCVGANKNYTYDANGFLDTVTDWEGNITDYDHDSRGLEIKRVEAKGTAQERTILTEWETGYRLPKKITEPERVIDFSYDANGQLLERKETPLMP